MTQLGWIVLVSRSPFRTDAGDFVVGPWRGRFAKFRAWWWATSYLNRNPYGKCDILPETCRIDVERTGRVLWPKEQAV